MQSLERLVIFLPASIRFHTRAEVSCPTSAWAFVRNSCHLPPQVLVLAWADNRKDLEVVWKVLSQVCLAYRSDGGRVVVVLCSRDKLVRAFLCHSNFAMQQTPPRAADCDLPLSIIHLKLLWVLPLGCGAVLPRQARASTCLSSEFRLLSLVASCAASLSRFGILLGASAQRQRCLDQHKHIIWGWCNYLTSAMCLLPHHATPVLHTGDGGAVQADHSGGLPLWHAVRVPPGEPQTGWLLCQAWAACTDY